MLIGYFLLKTKYMVDHEEWQLNNQIVMAESEVLARELKFRDFPNVTIGLQFSAKPPVFTKAMMEKAAEE